MEWQWQWRGNVVVVVFVVLFVYVDQTFSDAKNPRPQSQSFEIPMLTSCHRQDVCRAAESFRTSSDVKLTSSDTYSTTGSTGFPGLQSTLT